jgi:hypothetical protein
VNGYRAHFKVNTKFNSHLPRNWFRVNDIVSSITNLLYKLPVNNIYRRFSTYIIKSQRTFKSGFAYRDDYGVTTSSNMDIDNRTLPLATALDVLIASEKKKLDDVFLKLFLTKLHSMHLSG